MNGTQIYQEGVREQEQLEREFEQKYQMPDYFFIG
jgi:hypothetical protein